VYGSCLRWHVQSCHRLLRRYSEICYKFTFGLWCTLDIIGNIGAFAMSCIEISPIPLRVCWLVGSLPWVLSTLALLLKLKRGTLCQNLDEEDPDPQHGSTHSTPARAYSIET
jgi:hypothetical protein